MDHPVDMVLVLEDGTAFEGRSCGAVGEVCGWVHSEHGVVGYQEILTDPENRGQIVNMTYPLVGNCGVNDEDGESGQVQVSALVVKELSRVVSNWRAKGSLGEFIARAGVVGIEGVETRALEVHLRDHGEMRGILAPAEGASRGGLLAKVRSWTMPAADDLIRMAADPLTEDRDVAGEEGPKVLVYDLGVKRSLLAQLARCRCRIRRLPLDASWKEMEGLGLDGLFVAGGPGDPAELDHAAAVIRSALGRVPVFAAGLGMQMLAVAAGGRVRSLKTGHHGVNHPVRHRETGETLITAQNHRFAVDGDTLSGTGLRPTYVNLTDGTVEGILLPERHAEGVQFSPLPDDDGLPNVLIRRFVDGLRGAGGERPGGG